jgi:hypothetical protein
MVVLEQVDKVITVALVELVTLSLQDQVVAVAALVLLAALVNNLVKFLVMVARVVLLQ